MTDVGCNCLLMALNKSLVDVQEIKKRRIHDKLVRDDGMGCW